MYGGSSCSGRLDESLRTRKWKSFDGRMMIVILEFEIVSSVGRFVRWRGAS